MESLDYIYNKWRWLTYNNLDESEIGYLKIIDLTPEKIAKTGFKKYTPELLRDYRENNFKVSVSFPESWPFKSREKSLLLNYEKITI